MDDFLACVSVVAPYRTCMTRVPERPYDYSLAVRTAV